MNIILIGPQGSGKGTQAELLAKKYKLPVIGIGSLFRQEVQHKTKLGKKVGKYMLKGSLVPDHFTEELLKRELRKAKYLRGAIYDGFPRDYKQLKLLEKLIIINYVIFIGINQKSSIKRLSSRRICGCGQTYNIKTDRPKHALICDQCGKNLSQRADDTPQAIKNRLRIFKKETLPLLKYFKKERKLIKINGEASIKKVFSLILKDLKS
ncbi:MAG: nucleoside monophosphate kinase [Patescibacteria group bacterium]